jgi:hypothetical protein
VCGEFDLLPLQKWNESGQACRLQFLAALNEEVPRAMDRYSSGCLPSGRFPTFASDRQDRGRVILLSYRPLFPLTMPRDVAQE